MIDDRAAKLEVARIAMDAAVRMGRDDQSGVGDRPGKRAGIMKRFDALYDHVLSRVQDTAQVVQAVEGSIAPDSDQD